MSTLEKIEVLKGPAFDVYGADAFHGVISLQTWNPAQDTTEARTYILAQTNNTTPMFAISTPLIHSILACYYNLILHICPEVPLVYSNIAIGNRGCQIGGGAFGVTSSR